MSTSAASGLSLGSSRSGRQWIEASRPGRLRRERRTLQVSAFQVRTPQVGSVQIGAFQVGAVQVRLAQVGGMQAAVTQPGLVVQAVRAIALRGARARKRSQTARSFDAICSACARPRQTSPPISPTRTTPR